MEQQLQGSRASHAIDREATSGTFVPPNRDYESAFDISEYCFLVFYICEMALRIGVLRKRWFYTEEEGYMWGSAAA